MKKFRVLILTMLFILSMLMVASCDKGHTHDYQQGNILVEPLCDREGEQVYYCSCGVDKIEKIPALGHDKIYIAYKEPTCVAPGQAEGTYCSRCNTFFGGEVLEQLEHNYKEEVIEPTYDSPGLIRFTCEYCGDIKESTNGEQLEHTYSDSFSYNEHKHWNACLDQGYENLRKDEEDHTYEVSFVLPTYEEKGYSIYSCVACDYSYITDEVDKLEHTYSNELTYDEQKHWYYCTDEGYEDIKKDVEYPSNS